jgi:hypothetical protein
MALTPDKFEVIKSYSVSVGATQDAISENYLGWIKRNDLDEVIISTRPNFTNVCDATESMQKIVKIVKNRDFLIDEGEEYEKQVKEIKKLLNCKR